MTKSMLFLIAVLMVALGARAVLAGEEREYIGSTSVSTFPHIGIVALHELCKADFPDSHMCSSVDIVRNGSRFSPPFDASSSWVTPRIVLGDKPETEGSTTNYFVVDISGTRLNNPALGGYLSCNSWRGSASHSRGMRLGISGSLDHTSCFQSLPVACCAKLSPGISLPAPEKPLPPK